MRGKKFRYGIIGLGKQAVQEYIEVRGMVSSAELCAVCDTDPDRVKAVTKDLGVPGFTDVTKMLAESQLDFAIVAVPHDRGLEVIQLCVQAGVAILKEKPLAMDLIEARSILRLCENAGVILSVMPQRRFSPIYVLGKPMLLKLGQLFYAHFHYALTIHDIGAGWRAERSKAGGGCIIDMGYHMIDILLWYLPFPDHVRAELLQAARPEQAYNVEDTAIINFGYDHSPLRGLVTLSRCLGAKEEKVVISGSEGTIEITPTTLTRFNTRGKVEERLVQESKSGERGACAIEHFCHILSGREPNFGSAAAHVEHMSFINLCYAAPVIGQPAAHCVATTSRGSRTWQSRQKLKFWQSKAGPRLSLRPNHILYGQ